MPYGLLKVTKIMSGEKVQNQNIFNLTFLQFLISFIFFLFFFLDKKDKLENQMLILQKY